MMRRALLLGSLWLLAPGVRSAPFSLADSLRQLDRWPLPVQQQLARKRLLPGTPEAAVALSWRQRQGAGLPRLVYFDLCASLGRYYIDNNQYSQAVHELLVVRRQVWADSVRSSNAAIWLCYAHLYLEQPRQALKYGEEAARRLPRRPATRADLTNIYTILAGAAADLRDHRREEQYLLASLRIDQHWPRPAAQQRRELAVDYQYLSSAAMHQGRLAAAQHYLDSARSYLPVDDPAVELLDYQTAAELALAQHRYRAAEQALQPALAMIRTRPLWETEVLNLLVPALEGQGRYREALAQQKRLQELQAAAFQEKAQRNAQQLQEAYAAAEREQQISRQRRRIERLQAQQQLDEVRYSRRLAWLGAGVLTLVLLTSVGAVAWIGRQRRLRAAEEERLRQRLASDLHDEVGTLLTRVSMQAELLGTQQTVLTPALERLQVNTRTAARTMRDVVWGLDPQADTTASLLDRMRDFMHQTLGPVGLSGELLTEGWPADEALPHLLRQQVYLIFREAVTNAVKHARGARGVQVRLEQEAGRLRLSVRDDGQPLPAAVGKGLGLRSMRQRAESVGGTLHCGPQAGGGYGVMLEAPLV